jgi:penicillin G amidase
VSEVLGPQYLDTDRLARRRIDAASLAAQYSKLPDADQAIFRGMADGINAQIDKAQADAAHLMPKDFGDNAFMPARWTPIDVIYVYAHSMALRFSDLNSELDSLALLTRLRASEGNVAAGKLFDELRWVNDEKAPTTIATVDQHDLPIPTTGNVITAQLPNHLEELAPETLYGAEASKIGMLSPDDAPHASNAWLTGPSRTANGETVLTNGPQMGDFASTYIWTVGLHGAGFNVVGSGPVGSPWLVFGTNGDIGWGATAGLGDTLDIYQEHLDPQNPHRYLFKGQYLDMAQRRETIAVKGQTPESFTVYATGHGTVDLFDLAARTAYTRKRSWAGTEVASLVAWVHAMKAKNITQWRGQVGKVTISVNNYYADKHGNIAYQFLGLFPKRPVGQDFRLPVIGDGSAEWSGFHSPLTNPYVINPASGMIANWNNKPQPSYRNGDFMYWSRVDRVNEIVEHFDTEEKFTPDSLFKLVEKTSYRDVTARYFKELISVQNSHWADNEKATRASQIITRWDGTTYDSTTGYAPPGHILYQAFIGHLLRALYQPIIPKTGAAKEHAVRDFLDYDTVFPSMGIKIAYATLSSKSESALLGKRRAWVVIADALGTALNDVVATYGGNLNNWKARPTKHVFGTRNYAGVPQTTDTAEMSLPVLMNRGSENDQIVFTKGKVSYCDVTPPGESGFIAPDGTRSKHGADQLPLYQNFKCKPAWLRASDISNHAATSEQIEY